MNKAVKSIFDVFVASFILATVVGCSHSVVLPESVITLRAGEVVTFSENEAGGIDNGWWEAESAGNWSKSDRPFLILGFDDAFKNGMNLTLSMLAFVVEKNPNMVVSIKANEEFVKKINFNTSKTFEEVSLNLSKEILSKKKGMVTLTFEITGAAVPKEVGWSDDVRKLGILLSQLIAKPVA